MGTSRPRQPSWQRTVLYNMHGGELRVCGGLRSVHRVKAYLVCAVDLMMMVQTMVHTKRQEYDCFKCYVVLEKRVKTTTTIMFIQSRRMVLHSTVNMLLLCYYRCKCRDSAHHTLPTQDTAIVVMDAFEQVGRRFVQKRHQGRSICTCRNAFIFRSLA